MSRSSSVKALDRAADQALFGEDGCYTAVQPIKGWALSDNDWLIEKGFEYGHACYIEGTHTAIWHFIHEDYINKVYTCSVCSVEFALNPEGFSVVREGRIDMRVAPATRAILEDSATKQKWRLGTRFSDRFSDGRRA